MKSYLRPKSHRLSVDINMALYTSLILILMSILLIATVPLFRQPIPLHELAAIKTNRTTLAPIIITINQEGYRLNTDIQPEQLMSLDTIKEALNKQFKIMDPKRTSICIKSDATIPYGKVIEVIDWLESLGAQHVGLLINQSDVLLKSP